MEAKFITYYLHDLKSISIHQRVGLRTAPFGVARQGMVVTSYRRFGTTYWFHPQESRIQKISCILNPQKTGTTDWPETSARNYHYSLRNNPEKRRYHLICGGSMKSRKSVFCVCVCIYIYIYTHTHTFYKTPYKPPQNSGLHKGDINKFPA